MDLKALVAGVKNLFSKPADPKRAAGFTFFGVNNAGVYVTPDTALMASAFYACVDVISKSIASSNWSIYRRLPNGDHDALFDDPIDYYLNTRPNPDMTALSCKRSIMISALAWGNGYAEIQRTLSKTVAGIWPIHPSRVRPLRDGFGELYYEVSNEDGTVVRIDQVDMFHVRGPSIYGFAGDNATLRAARSLALYMAQERFAESYFGNNAQLGGIIEVPGKLDDPTFERLKKAFNSKHQGVEKSFNVGFLEGGMKWNEIDVKAVDAQLIEGRNQQIEEICRYFGVPPHKIQHLIRSTFNNIEHLGIEFVREALRPWAQEIQQEGSYKFFPDRAKKFIIVDLEWASQGDFLSRAQGYQIMRNIGALSVNDILKAERRNTIGSEGDIRIVNGAAIRLEDVGTNYSGTDKPKQTPESQGDAIRNSFSSWFSSVFDRVEKRHKSRMNYLKDYAKDYDREYAEFSDQFETYLREEVKSPCESLEKVSGHQCISAAILSAREIINGANSTETVERFLDQFI